MLASAVCVLHSPTCTAAFLPAGGSFGPFDLLFLTAAFFPFLFYWYDVLIRSFVAPPLRTSPPEPLPFKVSVFLGLYQGGSPLDGGPRPRRATGCLPS